MMNFQQQQALRKQQNAYIQQQKQAQQAQGTGAPNGAQNAQQSPAQAQALSSGALGASALPATSNVSGAAPASGPGAGHFTPQHLALLRQQIQAFKFLSKNAGVPIAMQQAIFAQRQRRQATAAQQSSQAASTPTTQSNQDGTKTGPDSGDAEGQTKSGPPVENQIKSIKLPWNEPDRLLLKNINYFDHTRRSHRPFIPGGGR